MSRKMPRWEYMKDGFTSKRVWLAAWLRKNYHRLKVVFVSQFGEWANKFRNDCGAACALMIILFFFPDLALTVDELYRSLTKKDRYLWVWEIQEALRMFEIETIVERGKTIQEFIDKRLGVIALINYIPLQKWERNPFSAFEGDHFVTVIGYYYDAGINTWFVIVHDPLYPEGSLAREIPFNVFDKAWAKLGRVAIVTAEPMPEKEI